MNHQQFFEVFYLYLDKEFKNKFSITMDPSGRPHPLNKKFSISKICAENTLFSIKIALVDCSKPDNFVIEYLHGIDEKDKAAIQNALENFKPSN